LLQQISSNEALQDPELAGINQAVLATYRLHNRRFETYLSCKMHKVTTTSLFALEYSQESCQLCAYSVKEGVKKKKERKAHLTANGGKGEFPLHYGR
jgi:hypothetical protein